MSIKRALYLASYFGGADRIARLASRPAGAIIMFHRVVESPAGQEFHPARELEVTPEVLRSVIRGLRGSGYEIVPMDAIPVRIADPKAPPFAALTFDDGYRDNLTLALPVCAELDAPFTVYLTTGFIDRTATIWWLDLESLIAAKPQINMTLAGAERSFETGTPQEKARAYGVLSHHLERASAAERQSCIAQMAERYGVNGLSNVRALALSWDEARELSRHPLVTIGAHTVSHPTLSSLTADQAHREIEEGRMRIESELGMKVAHFAYPYGGKGNAAPREFALCRELGFETAVTTRFGIIQRGQKPRLHALPRVPSNSFDDERTTRVKLSGLPALLARSRT